MLMSEVRPGMRFSVSNAPPSITIKILAVYEHPLDEKPIFIYEHEQDYFLGTRIGWVPKGKRCTHYGLNGEVFGFNLIPSDETWCDFNVSG